MGGGRERSGVDGFVYERRDGWVVGWMDDS